jgi:hypothetical protein
LLLLQGKDLTSLARLTSVQLNQTLASLYIRVTAISQRVALQDALRNYYAIAGTTASASFARAKSDLFSNIEMATSLLEARVYDNGLNQLPDLTVSKVDYHFPDSITAPTLIQLAGPANVTSQITVLGPVAVPDAPQTYAYSFTIPINNTNASSTPPTLGYLSTIVSTLPLQRVVNDGVGIGQTGQFLIVANAGSHFEVILPPLRTPDIYGVEILRGQYPAIDMAFRNQSGSLVNTHNSYGTAVSVGYTVLQLQ